MCGEAKYPWQPLSRQRPGSIPACAGKPGTTVEVDGRDSLWGLSPRVRGSPASDPVINRFRLKGLSPRVRGSRRAHHAQPVPSCLRGLSPRVRGSHYLATTWKPTRDGGSIPACAGKPRETKRRAPSVQFGSIPACAGKPLLRQDTTTNGDRSIPACAGKPVVALVFPRAIRKGLSPRVRGSRVPRMLRESLTTQPGLSPRVRGSHHGYECPWHGP